MKATRHKKHQLIFNHFIVNLEHKRTISSTRVSTFLSFLMPARVFLLQDECMACLTAVTHEYYPSKTIPIKMITWGKIQ